VATAVAFGAFAQAASANTQVGAQVTIVGAGTVSADTGSCSQLQPANAAAELTCRGWSTISSGDTRALDLWMTAQAAAGWRLKEWQGCDLSSGGDCLVTAPAGTTEWHYPKAIFEDAPPELLDVSLRQSASADGTVTAGWRASEPGVTFRCSTDGVTYEPCRSPYSARVPEGLQTVSIEATDPGGLVTLDQFAVEVVETRLDVAPGAGVFVARTAYGQGFECSLDGRPYSHCGTPGAGGTARLNVPAVAEGPHTLRVRARIGTRVDETPAVHRWTVVTTAPDTTIAPRTDPSPGTTAPAPAPAAVPASVPFTVRHTYRRGRLTQLVVTGAKATQVTVKRPGKRAAKTTVARLLGKKLPKGTKITVRAGTAARTITLR
jgi:hypothetical protein